MPVASRAAKWLGSRTSQGNHLHLLVEADDSAALARGMKALSGRFALALNKLMGRRGPVFSDRYHAHVLRTPTEVRHAIAYVLGNFVSHALRRGERVWGAYIDPYSSAAERGPDGLPAPVSLPESWLLRSGGGVAREPDAVYAVAASPSGSRRPGWAAFCEQAFAGALGAALARSPTAPGTKQAACG